MSDYRDPELEQMLGRMSGAYPDANTAYVAVSGRVRQVKRRRAFVASTAACLVLFGVGALAVRGGGSSQNVQPASESSSEATEATEATVTSVSTSVEDDSTSSSEESTSSVDETSSSVEPVTVASVPGVGSGSPSTNKGPSTSSSNTSGSSNSSGSSDVTVTVPNGQTTYPSDGGSIVVAVDNGALSLVSDAPAAGFTTKVKHDRGDRVEVEFSDGSTTWRIRVDLVNGNPVVETTQH
jgi:hypothetical protein